MLRPNERMSMLLEPMIATSSSIVIDFECRMYGPPVHPDLHARAQEHLVVAALRVVDDRLVALLRDEQLDLAARGGTPS